ncbi:MAG: hypothetical protein MZU97_14705 [Bacillus subtilis]|nr:hypothetical protein [Bacillus subtilis]
MIEALAETVQAGVSGVTLEQRPSVDGDRLRGQTGCRGVDRRHPETG